MPKHTTTLTVNGYQVTATFAEARNTAIAGRLKQILLSSFVNNVSVSSVILAMSSDKRYNGDGKTRAP